MWGFDKKYGRETDNREWVKAYLMCGVWTNIVIGVEVSGCRPTHNTNYFVLLMDRTAAHSNPSHAVGSST